MSLRRIASSPLQGGAHNDIQTMAALGSVAQGDSFTLTMFTGLADEETTAAIVADADPKITAAQVQAALEGLAAVAVGDVAVTGSDSAGFVFEFKGKLGFQSIPLLTKALTGLTGGTITHTTPGYDLTSVGDRNMVQSLVIAGGAGGDSFTLTLFNGETDQETTGSIAWDATPATVKAALEALENIAVGDVLVTGAGTADDPFYFEFDGKYAGQSVAALVFTGTGCTGTIATQVVAGGHEGDPVDVSGAQFIVFVLSKAPDEAAGIIDFEVSYDDGHEWSAFSVIRVSNGVTETSTDAAEVAETFYAQAPDGDAQVRASYAGTPFTSEAPLVTLIAFG